MSKFILAASLVLTMGVSLVACKPAESGSAAAKSDAPAAASTSNAADAAQGGDKKQ